MNTFSERMESCHDSLCLKAIDFIALSYSFCASPMRLRKRCMAPFSKSRISASLKACSFQASASALFLAACFKIAFVAISKAVSPISFLRLLQRR